MYYTYIKGLLLRVQATTQDIQQVGDPCAGPRRAAPALHGAMITMIITIIKLLLLLLLLLLLMIMIIMMIILRLRIMTMMIIMIMIMIIVIRLTIITTITINIVLIGESLRRRGAQALRAA